MLIVNIGIRLDIIFWTRPKQVTLERNSAISIYILLFI